MSRLRLIEATSGQWNSVQAFIPDPNKSQTNASMTGTLIFGASTDDVDITGWTAIKVRPTADSTYFYNSDTITKSRTLPADTETIVWVGQSGVTSVTFNFSGTAEVQGM